MNGGTIKNTINGGSDGTSWDGTDFIPNAGSAAGGGVDLGAYATFIMNGGAITENHAHYGGQLWVADNTSSAYWGQGVTGSINRGYTSGTANTIYAQPGGTGSNSYTVGANTNYVPGNTTGAGTGNPGDTGMVDTGVEDPNSTSNPKTNFFGLDIWNHGGTDTGPTSYAAPTKTYGIDADMYASK
jgi:hypothetical protein